MHVAGVNRSTRALKMILHNTLTIVRDIALPAHWSMSDLISHFAFLCVQWLLPTAWCPTFVQCDCRRTRGHRRGEEGGC